ncbi:MAG: hypothetical protein EBE86_030770 [Hormoscilla sp. GUM202]|nr:hypothetical protein [Hormoscilla sp. GUM202]
MNVTVRDREFLKTIDFQEIAAHLLAQGWQEKGRGYNDKGAIWRRNTGAENSWEILRPCQLYLADYAARIGDAIATLSKVEKRSQLDILSDLLTKAIDIDIQGMVIELGEGTGRVRMMAVVISKLRQIQIYLTSSDYNIARKAYHKRLPVRCNGDLIKKEKKLLSMPSGCCAKTPQASLQNPRNFRLDAAW